jgi:hypothetical protein
MRLNASAAAAKPHAPSPFFTNQRPAMSSQPSSSGEARSRTWAFMGTAAFLTIAAGVGTLLWQSGPTLTSPGANAQDADKAAAAAGFDTKDKAAIEAIVRAYILENPEIIPEAVEKLRGKQAAKRIAAVRSDVETPYASAFAGNPDGDVVLAEYSDFACGFCRQSVADVAKLIGEDKNLKIVFHELPILSDESRVAAAWGMAAAQQGKYYPFYKAMFAAGRPQPDHDRAGRQDRRAGHGRRAQLCCQQAGRGGARRQYPHRAAARIQRHPQLGRRQPGAQRRGGL